MSIKRKLSKHAKEQTERRIVPQSLIEDIVDNPEKVIEREGVKIYQSVVEVDENMKYLFRVVVDNYKKRNKILTVYKTSKIEKYNEN